jgi:hypothetical protein
VSKAFTREDDAPADDFDGDDDEANRSCPDQEHDAARLAAHAAQLTAVKTERGDLGGVGRKPARPRTPTTSTARSACATGIRSSQAPEAGKRTPGRARHRPVLRRPTADAKAASRRCTVGIDEMIRRAAMSWIDRARLKAREATGEPEDVAGDQRETTGDTRRS